ncbi:MAG: hypothetical protein ACYCY2_13230 [Acidithiobacillus ferriphilus]|jgi:hypothetical protein|uniref:hypothetical protein n=1 Tax=Thiomonas sp. TaxID=2047785 RepID=UPI000BC57E2E|nr:hypothetical protein [Thiomonas sp.]OZB43527.1 MAG: hypothetical protein B7X46_12370 [Thiomonas sp. 15-66-11]OZB57685.1 MAG: hypothetical protein B7X31_14830 [Thiomonas sp. 13-66-29]
MSKPEDPIDRLLKLGIKCLLTDKDVALILGIKPSGMRQRRHKHPETLPPSIVNGKFHRYVPEDVAAWLLAKKRER